MTRTGRVLGTWIGLVAGLLVPLMVSVGAQRLAESSNPAAYVLFGMYWLVTLPGWLFALRGWMTLAFVMTFWALVGTALGWAWDRRRHTRELAC